MKMRACMVAAIAGAMMMTAVVTGSAKAAPVSFDFNAHGQPGGGFTSHGQFLAASNGMILEGQFLEGGVNVGETLETMNTGNAFAVPGSVGVVMSEMFAFFALYNPDLSLFTVDEIRGAYRRFLTGPLDYITWDGGTGFTGGTVTITGSLNESIVLQFDNPSNLENIAALYIANGPAGWQFLGGTVSEAGAGNGDTGSGSQIPEPLSLAMLATAAIALSLSRARGA